MQGGVGTGFSNDLAVELKKTLNRLESAQPKFKAALSSANSRDVKWVEPTLVAEVEFRGWTSDNLLRQASFKGLREDKSAKEIRREAFHGPPKPKVVSRYPTSGSPILNGSFGKTGA